MVQSLYGHWLVSVDSGLGELAGREIAKDFRISHTTLPNWLKGRRLRRHQPRVTSTEAVDLRVV
jgi:hypothetical protein